MSFSPDLATGRQDSRMLQRHLLKAAQLWKLSDSEACTLFALSARDLARMREGEYNDRLDAAQIERAGVIIALGNSLRLLFSGSRTYSWPKAPNMDEAFGGRSPVDIMVAGGLPAMTRVRQHIEGLGISSPA